MTTETAPIPNSTDEKHEIMTHWKFWKIIYISKSNILKIFHFNFCIGRIGDWGSFLSHRIVFNRGHSNEILILNDLTSFIIAEVKMVGTTRSAKEAIQNPNSGGREHKAQQNVK